MSKYVNANKVLPEKLVREIQKYIQGTHIYIPNAERKLWGSESGLREELEQRNVEIIMQFRNGFDISKLSEMYCLSEERIKAIVYRKK
ncbi:CD3324 family protein [Paenibacillus thermotolerans]|uniref:CD3324 family protein n=1 Tax=Paenibacillus thermotolerans TaxID=3027807 RepID=UPI0023685F46|nr:MULTISPECIES: CD3324 family protein [unclassified Paenibacillus]